MIPTAASHNVRMMACAPASPIDLADRMRLTLEELDNWAASDGIRRAVSGVMGTRGVQIRVMVSTYHHHVLARLIHIALDDKVAIEASRKSCVELLHLMDRHDTVSPILPELSFEDLQGD